MPFQPGQKNGAGKSNWDELTAARDDRFWKSDELSFAMTGFVIRGRCHLARDLLFFEETMRRNPHSGTRVDGVVAQCLIRIL